MEGKMQSNAVELVSPDGVVGVRLGESVRQLLTTLAAFSRSSVVVLRSVAADVRKLELIAFARGTDAPALGSEFQIPLQKSFETWGSDDPACSWGFCSHKSIKCGGDYFSDSEQAFVEWVKQKAWFPIECDGVPLVLVLLRGDEIAYTWDEVISAWLYAQAFVSQVRPDNAADHRC